MKKFLLALAVALAYACLFAAVETVELSAGGTWESPGCRALAVRAVSSVASGTANVAGVFAYAVTSNETKTVTDTEVLWRRVLTNTTTRTVSRTVPTGETLYLTNTIGSVTCSGGLGYAAPSGAGAYIAPGEKVGWSGTAKGRVWLFIER